MSRQTPGLKPLTDAQRELAAQWEHLVIWCLNKWPRIARRLGDEAEGVAQLALTEAARRFDPDRGFVFSTYATKTIRGYLLTAFYRGGLVRVKAVDSRLPILVVSLDAELPSRNSDSNRAARRKDFLAAPDQRPRLDPDERETLARALEFLAPRAREVLARRFVDGWTLNEVGQAMGLTRERVRQIEATALEKLRGLLCLTDGGGLAMARDAQRRTTV